MYELSVEVISERDFPDWSVGMFDNFLNTAQRSLYGIIGASRLIHEVHELDPDNNFAKI